MKNCIIKVKGYGKINEASIEPSDFMLFVGDNNSGKSYLMSLLWGIENLTQDVLLKWDIRSGQKTRTEQMMFDWAKKQLDLILKQEKCIVSIKSIIDKLQAYLNEKVKQNKNELMKKIFNSRDVVIQELEIKLKVLDNASLYFKHTHNDKIVVVGLKDMDMDQKITVVFSNDITDTIDSDYWLIITSIYFLLLGIKYDKSGTFETVYLPAARTGFMLTKDIINKVSRRSVYNLDMEDDITPFTRPVNQFLDVINDLSMNDSRERYSEIAKELEDGMIDGAVHMSTLPNKEVYYVPSGSCTKLPLRVVSAVVSELSPLILILKHMNRLKMVFYEEPEMCLHPQLQQKMARVLCRLNHAGLNMIVTTHSDLILQHINNMIRLSCREDADEICRQFGYTSSDMLSPERVKVYQLSTQAGGMTKVEELECSENGFAVPTFNQALEKINDEAYIIQE